MFCVLQSSGRMERTKRKKKQIYAQLLKFYAQLFRRIDMYIMLKAFYMPIFKQ